MSCVCKKEFDYESAVNLKYGSQLENFRFKAKVRLDEICNETCFICLNTYKNNKANIPNGNFKMKVEKMEGRKEKNIVYNISNGDHLICKKCVEVFKRENRNKIKKGKSKNYFPINCNICETTHEFCIENILKLFKSEGGCCNIF